MSKSLDESLNRIASGTMLVFVGVTVSMALNFFLRILLVRYMSQEDYGIYSLGITLVSMVCAVSLLGLDEGTSRYIAFYTGRSEPGKARSIAYSSLALAIVSSLIFALALFFMADAISVRIFHSPGLAAVLRALSFAVPVTVITQTMISVMRGFNIPMARVLFSDILRPLTFLALLAAVVLLNMGFIEVVYAYIISLALVLLLFVLFLAVAYRGRLSRPLSPDNSMAGSLLRFSLPLLSVNLLLMMMSQATTLMLGYFKTPVEVGELDVVMTLASTMLIVINSVGYIFTPVVSSLYGKGHMDELKMSYVVSTRWGYICTLPTVFIFLIFPGAILNLLFGARYVPVSFALQIIAIGYILNPITGPNYHTLIAMGKTSVIIQSFLVNAVLNIVLGFLLIPPFGVVGAALSTGISATVANVLLSVRLYQIVKVHPLTPNYLKSIFLSLALMALFYFAAQYTGASMSIYAAISCLALYLLLYAIILVAVKALDDEDINLIRGFEKRLGMDIVSRLGRFVASKTSFYK